MDILYSATTASINITKSNMKPHNGNLIKFFGKHVPMKGIMRLRVTLGTWPVVVKMDVDFLVVDTANNAILGRMLLNKAYLDPHLLMKFPMLGGIDQVHVDQVATKRCYMANHRESSKTPKENFDDYQMITIESLDLGDEKIERNPKLTKESKIEEVKLFDETNPQSVKIEKNLLLNFKQKLIKLLKKYHECE